MPNVLPQTQNEAQKEEKRGWRVSILGIFMAIILAIVIIMLGERIMFDLNRVANPLAQSTFEQDTGYSKFSGAYWVSESSNLSNVRIYYPREKTEQYKLYKLLIHAAFVLPAFLLMFLLYYQLNLKKKNTVWRAVVWAYMIGAIWVLLHLIGEAGRYVLDAYKNAAIYIILVFLAVILTSLAVFLQKKKEEA